MGAQKQHQQCETMYLSQTLTLNKVYAPKILNTYPKSSLISFFDASKGTLRTKILEVFCLVNEADLRFETLSLIMKKENYINLHHELKKFPRGICENKLGFASRNREF